MFTWMFGNTSFQLQNWGSFHLFNFITVHCVKRHLIKNKRVFFDLLIINSSRGSHRRNQPSKNIRQEKTLKRINRQKQKHFQHYHRFLQCLVLACKKIIIAVKHDLVFKEEKISKIKGRERERKKLYKNKHQLPNTISPHFHFSDIWCWPNI